jgi:hypothetical protein
MPAQWTPSYVVAQRASQDIYRPGENASFPTSGQNDLFDMTGLTPTPSGRPQEPCQVEATNA